jgi:iron complex transport system ATP-binding protein
VLLDGGVTNDAALGADLTPDSRPHPDVVVDVRDVTVSRNGNALLEGLQWRVELDERWVVLGPNGAGKTTLLSLAAARMHPTSGSVHLLGERLGRVDVFELRPRIGLSTALLAERIPPSETVHDVVVTAAYAVVGRFREAYEAMDEVRARALLEQLGVVHLADRRYGTLSEGERKRVQIARALMTDPELLLLDEPAAGLDLGGREDLVRRLAELAYDPSSPTLVLVTHHVEEIPPGFTHALLLRDGRAVAQGLAADVLTDDNLSQTFGLPLKVERQGGRYFARAVG